MAASVNTFKMHEGLEGTNGYSSPWLHLILSISGSMSSYISGWGCKMKGAVAPCVPGGLSTDMSGPLWEMAAGSI